MPSYPVVRHSSHPAGIVASYVRLGQRRAKRVSRWFGGAGSLPRAGYQRDLDIPPMPPAPYPFDRQRTMRLVNLGGTFELRGESDTLAKVCRLLEDQERAERKGGAS